jgi:hypothetical protein
MSGTVDCAAVTGTYVSGIETVTIAGTLSPDGRTLDATYAWDALPDHGTFAIAIHASPQSVAVGDTSIFEGGALEASEVSAAAPVTEWRVARVPLTLSEAAPAAVTVTYRLVGVDAQRGVDFVD